MLCYDIMELVGQQVRVERITQDNKKRFNLVLDNIKHKRGDFKSINLNALKGWW